MLQHDLIKAQLGQLHHQADQIVLHLLVGGGGPVQPAAVLPAVAAAGADGVGHVGAQGLILEAGQTGYGIELLLIPGGQLLIEFGSIRPGQFCRPGQGLF